MHPDCSTLHVRAMPGRPEGCSPTSRAHLSLFGTEVKSRVPASRSEVGPQTGSTPSSAGLQSTHPALAGSAQRRGRRPADRTERTLRQCGLTQLTPAGARPITPTRGTGHSTPRVFPDVSVKDRRVGKKIMITKVK